MVKMQQRGNLETAVGRYKAKCQEKSLKIVKSQNWLMVVKMTLGAPENDQDGIRAS
jgi:hypothetical protein